jgi:hypothetical protein
MNEIYWIDNETFLIKPHLSGRGQYGQYGYADIRHYGIAKAWASIDMKRMVMSIQEMTVTDSLEKRKWYIEKLVRYLFFSLKHEIGINPAELEMIVFDKRLITLSMHRFRKLTIVKQ